MLRPIYSSEWTSDAPNSYTRVKIDTEFIAVGGHNFAEMSYAQLASCTNYNELYLCEKHILQVHESSLTCSSAIFWGASPEDVNKHCDFEYRHLIQLSPCILEADNHVLLTNLGKEWSFRCTDDNLPQRVVGSNFAVIHRNNFCSCALVGQNYFIPQRMEDCEKRPDHVELMYPINAAVATVFYQEIDNEALLKDLSKLYTTPQNLNIPKLNLTMPPHDPEVLINNDLTQIIDLKQIARAIRSKQEIFLNKQDKNKHQQRFENWFDSVETVSMSITFLLALTGTFACFLGIYNCIKGHKVMALFGALTAQTGGANALEIGANCAGTRYYDIIREGTFQITLVIMIFCLYHLNRYFYKRWSIIKILVPNAVNQQKGSMTHIHLEIGNPNRGSTKIYLCSFHARIMSLKMKGIITGDEMKMTMAKFWTHGILDLGETLKYFKLSQDGLDIKLPTIAYVAVWSSRKLGSVLREQYQTRLLMTYDGMTYILPNALVEQKYNITPMANPSEDVWCFEQMTGPTMSKRHTNITDTTDMTLDTDGSTCGINLHVKNDLVPSENTDMDVGVIPPTNPSKTRLQY